MITAATTTGSTAASSVLVIIFILVAIAAYWVPTVVAYVRRSEIPNLGSIVVINAFLGWTMVGWVVALAMAMRSRPQQPQYVVPPGWVPGPGYPQGPGYPPASPPDSPATPQ